jgi:hypothetical protein
MATNKRREPRRTRPDAVVTTPGTHGQANNGQDTFGAAPGAPR